MKTLEKFDFSIDMDLGEGRILVSRKGENATNVTMQGKIPQWPSKLPAPDDEKRISLSVEDWRTVLGNVIFGIPVGLPSYSPTFRMLFPFFVQEQRLMGGFARHSKQGRNSGRGSNKFHSQPY